MTTPLAESRRVGFSQSTTGLPPLPPIKQKVSTTALNNIINNSSDTDLQRPLTRNSFRNLKERPQFPFSTPFSNKNRPLAPLNLPIVQSPPNTNHLIKLIDTKTLPPLSQDFTTNLVIDPPLLTWKKNETAIPPVQYTIRPDS